jgi:cysteine desulfuration protein SufE
LSQAATKLDEVVEEFAGLEPRERLELLLDFADNLPPLPPEYQARRDAGENRVHECQTAVYLWVELRDGRVQLYADVAPEAPTVKGYVAILVDAFTGATPDEVLAVKPDLLHRLGLVDALGMVRMRGLGALLNRVREGVRDAQAA